MQRPVTASAHEYDGNEHGAHLHPVHTAEIPVKHQEQIPQAVLEQEEDVYAGLERGSDSLAPIARLPHVAFSSMAAARYMPHALSLHAPATDHPLPIQADQQLPAKAASGQGSPEPSPEQGSSGKGPEQGQLRPRRQHRGTVKIDSTGASALKAAEAPLVKQGSYAVAAKLARQRTERRQQEIQQMDASQRQVRVSAAGIGRVGQVSQSF